MSYADGNSQHSSGMEGFYGSKDYSSMIAQGKIAKDTRIIILKPAPQGFIKEEYIVLNQSRIKRNGLRMNPNDVLDGVNWFVDNRDLNPLERMALR